MMLPQYQRSLDTENDRHGLFTKYLTWRNFGAEKIGENYALK